MASGKNSNSSTDITETHSESQSGVTTQLESDANKKTYNILLLGETGVGKSTFVNAFFYYLTYESLDAALKAKDITALVPTRFTMMDNDYNEKLIVYGEDENESHIPGVSATKSPRSYTFRVGTSLIRLIDTPGVGDTEGMDKDKRNFERLFSIIGELEDIHAICILLKPNNSNLSVLFDYCIKQLLSRLQRSASRNIVFLFTNTRGTLYRPGDTVVPLKETLAQIARRPPNVLIPFQKRNIFCIDNEAFRFLVANKEGIDFNEDEKENFATSWNKSSSVCFSLLNYITKLKPHKIQDTVSINEARRLILRLSRPLAEISDNIEKNLELIRRHNDKLSDDEKSIEELKDLLDFSVERVDPIALRYPRTVCAAPFPSCANKVDVNKNTTTWIYKSVCHDKCSLVNGRLKTIIELDNCEVMLKSTDKTRTRKFCTKCNHASSIHMHVLYRSEVNVEILQVKEIASNIDSTKAIMEKVQKTIESLEEKILKYEDERTTLVKSMAKFAHFLFHNSIVVYEDKYNEHLDLLIERENSLGDHADKKAIERYTTLKKSYEEERKRLEDILAQQKLTDSSKIAAVTVEEVMETVKKLYKLKLTGNTVKNFCHVQDSAMKNMMLTNTEKTFTSPEAMIPKLESKVPSLFKKIF